MVESVSEDAAFLAKSNLVSQRLEYIIGYSLDQCQFRSAVFLAERLVSHLRSPGHSEGQREYAQYLLATSHYRQGKSEAAWAVLEGCKTSRCRYLFAQCCLDLRRYVECNGVLEFLLEDKALAKCPTAGKHCQLDGVMQ
jgi:anaphase-promoting complex subunit 3